MPPISRLLLLLFLFVAVSPARGQVQPPDAFLGYELGERFTPHHRVVDYVRHVAEQSPRVQVQEYGETVEGRPLIAAVISSPDHLARLEAIRIDNLRRVGLEEGGPAAEGPAIVFLSYNVHGNEAAGTEAALATLYDLADSENGQTGAWLEEAVVILDPALNPDGRDRYVQWYRQTRGRTPNPDVAAREHHEPWPGGRVNHYLFDLNRDWSWATQQETRSRLALYHRWMPHIHADVHEQGYDENYFFAPAAAPLHEAVTGAQRALQRTIGRRHADYFDEEGWLYFTKETFDLVYPGYGDTWPTFNGAVGMTYEQAGIDAGLAVEVSPRDTLTLAERIARHHTTSLSTVEIAARERERIVQSFAEYFRTARAAEEAEHAAYLIKTEGAEDRVAALTELLDRQHIRYGWAQQEGRTRGRSYGAGAASQRVRIERGDLIVPVAQPKGVLTEVLFEPTTHLTDSLTYDITAWALPYAYGLEAYALQETVRDLAAKQPAAAPAPAPADAAYGYVLDWNGLQDAQVLAELMQHDVQVRVAQAPFRTGGRSFGRGSLLLLRSQNDDLERDFDDLVTGIAARYGQRAHPVTGGWTESGPDLGSATDVRHLERPRVAVLGGEATVPQGLGSVWHLLDEVLRYPATLLRGEMLDAAPLYDYDLLILPPGDYARILSEKGGDRLRAWIEDGGRLVAIGSALSSLEGRFGLELRRKEQQAELEERVDLKLFADRYRAGWSGSVSGAIFEVALDATHPLAYGYDGYYTLKRGASAYAPLENGWSVGLLQESEPVSGFAGSDAVDALENTLVFGVESLGRGEVVYMVDNPLFRGFWHHGHLLFANALFQAM